MSRRDFDSELLPGDEPEESFGGLSVGKRARTDGIGGSGSEPARIPGKQTLTGRLAAAMPAPVMELAVARDAPRGAPTPDRLPPAVTQLLARERGEPLADADRFTRFMGVDVSAARVVTGSGAAEAAESVGANAFALGDRIVFGAGQYAPGTESGDRLIRHELTHVVQQGAQPVTGFDGIGVTSPDDHAEGEARDAAAGHAVTPGSHAPVLARDATKNQATDRFSLARDFFEQYHLAIYGHLVNHETTAKGLIVNLAQAAYIQINNERQFLSIVFAHLFAEPAKMYQTLGTLFGEDEVALLVMQGRDDKARFYLSKDPVAWQSTVLPQWDHVANDLAARLVAPVFDSLNRLGPRYAYLRTALWRREYRLNYETKYKAEGRTPDVWEVPQVDAALLTPAHPIDRVVITAMCTRTMITPHFKEVQRDFPQVEYDAPDQSKELRPVRVLFENTFAKGGEQLSCWLTIAEPADATIEEVANTLYGDPAQAYVLVKAGRRVGFPFNRHTKPYFLPAIQEQYFKTTGYHEDVVLRDQTLAFKGPQSSAHVSVDPVRELLAHPEAGESAIKAQAAGMKAVEPATALAILQRYSFIINDLVKIEGLLPSLPVYKGSVQPVLERTRARAEQIKADNSKAEGLDVPSLMQQQVTSASTSALDNLAVAYQKLATSMDPGDKWGDAWHDTKRPYLKVGGLYLDALAASELPQTGPDRLALAQRAAQEMPIEILEAMLSGVRAMIQAASTSYQAPTRTHPHGFDYGLFDMEALQRDCRERLQAARQYVVTDPSKVYPIIEYVQAKIFELQVNATLFSGIEECNELIHSLDSRLSKLGSVTGKNDDYRDRIGKLKEFVKRWDDIYQLYVSYQGKSGDDKKKAGEELKTAFDALRNDEQWKGQYQIVQKLIEDGETFEKWVRIGIMIGIAVATMGAGTLASGVVAGMELGALTTGVVVAGTEALTFTTLSRIVNENPDNKAFLAELKENFVTFGVFRALSAGYRGVIGAKAAGSAPGVVGEMVGFQIVQTVHAVHTANEEMRRKYGRDLTADEMDDIIVENLVVAGATALIGFAGARRLEAIRKAGEKIGRGISGKVDGIHTLDDKTIQLARAAEQTKKPADLHKALENERLALQRRKDLLDELTKTPERASAAEQEAGLPAGTLATMAAEVGTRLAQNRTATDMLKLEPAGGDQFLYPSGKNGGEIDAFLKRQKEELEGDWKPLDADPYTGARRFRVTPKEGPAFTVTEKLAGMGRVIGGLDRAPTEPHSGMPDMGKAPLFTAQMVVSGENIRVGHSVESVGDGLTILRGLADGDPNAYWRIGVDKPHPSEFDPMAVEWGLGRMGKEIIFIRGERGAVNWAAFPGVEPLAHTHPFRGDKKLKGGSGEHGSIPFDSLKPGGRTNLNNRVVVFPSAADIIFCGLRGIDGHVVQTPYRLVKQADGSFLLQHPDGKGTGEPLSFVIGKPEHVGYWEGDPDIPVYKAVLKAPGTDFEHTVYAVNHPGVGSLVEFTKPASLHDVAPGSPPPTADPVTEAGTRFEPKTPLERRAFEDWQQLKGGTRTYRGAMTHFQRDFLPMYREGWEFDFNSSRWRRPYEDADARQFAPGVTAETAYQALARKRDSADPFIKMLIEGKFATKDQIIAELRNLDPGGRYIDAVRSQLKESFRDTVAARLAEMPRKELEKRYGRLPPGPEGLASGRHRRFLELTRHLNPSDRGNLGEDFYQRTYSPDSEAHVAIDRADNRGLRLASDRVIDTLETEQVKSDGKLVDEHTGVEVKTINGALSDRELQQARDYLRMLAKNLTVGNRKFMLDKLRYVFMTEVGARLNLDFMVAMLKDERAIGMVHFEVFDSKGKRYKITSMEELAAKELQWLTRPRERPTWQNSETAVGEKLRDMGLDVVDQASYKHGKSVSGGTRGSTRPDWWDKANRISVDSKNYGIETSSGRHNLVQDVVGQAQKRAKHLPDGNEQWVVIDTRGQAVAPEALERIQIRIEEDSGGLIKAENVFFIQDPE